MTNSTNVWDTLAEKNFNTHLKPGEIDPRAADNILLAWPEIMKCISQNVTKTLGLLSLDYGCGTGAFCTQLENLGFKVTGIDPSTEMIRYATEHTPKSIQYIVGDSRVIPTTIKYSTITSIMAIQFVQDIDKTFNSLAKSLEDNGIFILVVFNTEWVKMCLDKRIGFSDFDSVENPRMGMKTFGELTVPVYIRDTDEYNSIAKKYNLKNIFESCPPFTKEFIKQYPDNRPKDVSEYLILGYRKIQ